MKNNTNYSEISTEKTTDESSSCTVNLLPIKPCKNHDEHVSIELQQILILLHKQTGYDFSLYKPNTIIRRIQKRLQILQIDTLAGYVYYLHHYPPELMILFKRLLIHVTHFFRDKLAFELLKNQLLTKTLKEFDTNTIFRVWIPGCSTGEEAYSIAIILQECMNILNLELEVRIFGTDVDPDAIETARVGVFSHGIEKSVSSERLKKFFIKENNFYKIDNNIRKMVIFAAQNVITDPPFTKLSLICCRNLLIYLTLPLQHKILHGFHSGLNPNGLLFLGPSESISSSMEHFNLIDQKWRLYERKQSEPLHTLQTHQLLTPGVTMTDNTTRQIESKLSNMIKDIMSKSYTPAFIVIDEKGDIVYIYGRTSKFLELASGDVRLHFMSMIRPELKSILHIAIRKAGSQQKEVLLQRLQIHNGNDHEHYINVKISPIKEMESFNRALLLIIIEDTTVSEALQVEINSSYLPSYVQNELHEKTNQLTEELKQAQHNFQTMIEEMEASNEELRSINEEAQATNEELQSLNEELTIINTELENRIEYLFTAKNELKILLENTEIATICLDKNLCIKRYTPKATHIINLIPADIGRPINHLVSNLQNQELINDLRTALKTMETIETEGIDKNGHYYLIRIVPYRLQTNIAGGITLTFFNLHNQKQAESKIKILEGTLI